MKEHVVVPLTEAGIMLFKLGQTERALDAFQYAANLTGNHPFALMNMAMCHRELGDPEKALEVCRMIPVDKRDWTHFNNLAHIYQQMGKFHLARHYFKKSVAANPDAWEPKSNLIGISTRLGLSDEVCKKQGSNYLFGLNYSDESREYVFKKHREWGEQVVAACTQYTHERPSEPRRQIRIGYVSGEFHQHSTMYYFLPLLEHRNRFRFHATCFAGQTKRDALTSKIEALCDDWVDILAMTPDEAAKEVYERKIDILVDLSGHTGNNKLLIFARKPAPVQVSYIGYPNTTGLPTMDYRLTDWYADPPGSDRYYTEKLVRLDGCFLCYKPEPVTPIVTETPALKNGYVTFGCFNNHAKINDRCIEVWSRILRGVPSSRIILKEFVYNDPVVRHRMWRRFARHGIERERIDLIPLVPDFMDHMKLYGEVDIALDAFPYNGTTTTCEAMWMGVPVVTMIGDRHAGRVGWSLLNSVMDFQEGLNWIATTRDGYTELSIQAANDIEALNDLRMSLRPKMHGSNLMHAWKHARKIEKAYERMWGDYVEGR